MSRTFLGGLGYGCVWMLTEVREVILVFVVPVERAVVGLDSALGAGLETSAE